MGGGYSTGCVQQETVEQAKLVIAVQNTGLHGLRAQHLTLQKQLQTLD